MARQLDGRQFFFHCPLVQFFLLHVVDILLQKTDRNKTLWLCCCLQIMRILLLLLLVERKSFNWGKGIYDCFLLLCDDDDFFPCWSLNRSYVLASYQQLLLGSLILNGSLNREKILSLLNFFVKEICRIFVMVWKNNTKQRKKVFPIARQGRRSSM